MEVNKRRLGSSNRASVVAAGSVWEIRMKSDEVKGGIKVFNAEENSEESGSKLKRTPFGKRKTWKSESSEGLEKSPIQKGKTENQRNSEEQSKEQSISDGIKKSPIQTRKLGSSERIPIRIRKLRSETMKNAAEFGREGGESGKLRKTKSDSVKKNESGSVNSSIQLRKTKSELDPVQDGSNDVCEKEEVENVKNVDAADDENCKDFDLCQDKEVSSVSENVGGGAVESSPENSVQIVGDDSDDVVFVDDEEEEEEDELNEEVEVEMEEETFEVKEISIPVLESKETEKNKVVEKIDQEMKDVVMSESEKKKNQNEMQEQPKKVVSANMRFHLRNERKPVSSVTLKQSPPIRRNSTIYKNFSETNSIPKAEEFHSFPQTQSKLQSLVDLIMWRDVSRSAFIFGFGTFIIISSSYAKDINLSVISVMSYLGLVYLAIIFLYRSLICRGIIDVEDSNYVVGEEDAIWMLKLILPYLNEFLSKLKALFSGDPGTTIKLAVLLFVLARCGSFITVWKMAKFGFFGVFTVPKICSSYSAQLTAYGNFWIRRFRDAWDSCTHKKAVALGIFGLVWNLSSVVARIWAVFVLFVAFKYYQQHYLVREEWMEDEAACDEFCEEEPVRQKQQGRSHNFVDTNNKFKKGF